MNIPFVFNKSHYIVFSFRLSFFLSLFPRLLHKEEPHRMRDEASECVCAHAHTMQLNLNLFTKDQRSFNHSLFSLCLVALLQ